MSYELSTFVDRHIGPRSADQDFMLARLGYSSLDALMSAAVPAGIRDDVALDLPAAQAEHEVLAQLRGLADRNNPGVSMIGLGYHPTLTPGVIRRNVLEDPSWYTAYTPYQPEISQGRLEALLNFQTMVADLTGLPTANSSLLDEGTAAAEAMTLMRRAVRGKAELPIVIDARLLPQTLSVIRTRAAATNIEVIEADLLAGGFDAIEGPIAGAIIAQQTAAGQLVDVAPLIEQTHTLGGLATVVSDPLALVIVKSPGSLGADVVVGSSQRFGVPMFFGGPHAGFMSVREGLERHLPGRLVGVSVDSAGAPALRLALQTREQHIRREKATSNICTAQVLLAVAASMYAVYHGPAGLRAIALDVQSKTARLLATVEAAGFAVETDNVFDTVRVSVPGRAAQVQAAARAEGIHIWLADDDHVQISVSEATSEAHLGAVLKALGVDGPLAEAGTSLNDAFVRTDEILTHPVFNSHHSETQMLRYLKKLSDRDYALDRGMIPLGSCTMKLNATTEMEPISWPGFAELHPFVPADDARGFIELIETLETWLATVTGYAAVSVQPNAGSQGEFAGLHAIVEYQKSRGEGHRNVCLIPSSAHGTNAASAVMAGMRVVIVKATDSGEVDLDDLRAQCDAHADDLAAVMVTYPSTHGVYEEGITELCEIVHAAGGQVYVDGANLNALLGHARPGAFGGDVSHLNLHKTFCIPHGGGGPGVGPVAVAEHLKPFLPKHPFHPNPELRGDLGTISAAPYGSAGILAIPFAYVALMGAAGLTQATSVAVLSANYVAARLADHFPVLYTGDSGLVAHECILDLRSLSKETGVSVDDVAKRLIDYGFHAPTMSFPVAGTLMVEPTESEDLAELDRFCDAMISIRAEIDKVAAGEWPSDDNPLTNAPHPAAQLLGWSHAYTVADGVFPSGSTADKYWPPVARIDQAHGDRNLICSCPPLSELAEG
ncbi:MAG: aminomethyl-transferring glycine dehydrogenase [Aeromicrobium sp.]|nr:MAG: aminomethyl-transferring glycine dehydrogenase [Aeromicrobium sp.]